MLDVVLVEPEIPPNTGNVVRLAANTGARLHLVEPLGFSLDDRSLRRAGLDYHEIASVQVHRDWHECRTALAGRRMLAFTTRAARIYTDFSYALQDVLVFGAETRGLSAAARKDSRSPWCCSRPGASSGFRAAPSAPSSGRAQAGARPPPGE